MADDGTVALPVRDPALAGMAREALARRRSTLRVRRLATEHGLDLARMPGTGFGGRVRPDDVAAYVEQQRGAVAVQHRRATGQQLPAATIIFEVDVTGVVRRCARQGEEFRRRFGVALTDRVFVIRAAIAALNVVPSVQVQASRVDGVRPLHRAVHLGVGVALEDAGTPDGAALALPVVRHADRLSVVGIARALAESDPRARAGALQPDERDGATFALNEGSARWAAAILPPPLAALLTTEAPERRLVVATDAAGSDRIVVRSCMDASLTYDTGVIDVLTAARFLRAFQRAMADVGAAADLW